VSNSGFTSQKLNLTLALCAVLISVASFYATYLQASAAEKQVKAMTLPLIQQYSGNYDNEAKAKIITFYLENAGVGPALIKSVSYNYQGVEYPNRTAFLKACCDKEFKDYRQKLNNGVEVKFGILSSKLLNTIIPAQTKIKHYQIHYSELANGLWKKLNDERFKVKLNICYCSLLDECYVTKKNGVVEPVASCPVEQL